MMKDFNFTSNFELENLRKYETLYTDSIKMEEEKENLAISLYYKICVSIIFLLMLSFSLFFYLFPKAKQSFFEILSNVSDYGIIAYVFLILVGCLMILLGIPFLIFEIYVPFVLKTYLLSVIIVFATKILGVSLSFWVSRTVFFIPFFIKNYGVPLLKVSFLRFSLIYTLSQLILSFWFIYFGINANEYLDLEKNDNSIFNLIIFGIFSILILVMIYYYMRKTMKKYNYKETNK